MRHILLTTVAFFVSASSVAQIPAPSEVELKGLSRKSEFSSDLGRISVRWQRSFENCLGRSPSRAASDALATANRAIKNGRFLDSIKVNKNNWEMVFTDLQSAETNFPSEIIKNRHPGFMLPPNLVYLISDFILPECSSSKIGGEILLSRVLLHEIGHVIEFSMLGELFPGDARRAEGFASWFESYASGYSSVIPKDSVFGEQKLLAKDRYKGGDPFDARFYGSAGDYAVSAIYFAALVKKRGVSGLMDVYKVMLNRRITFKEGVRQVFGWSSYTIEREIKAII